MEPTIKYNVVKIVTSLYFVIKTAVHSVVHTGRSVEISQEQGFKIKFQKFVSIKKKINPF